MKMRKALFGSAGLLALAIASGASAADLPRKTVAPVFAAPAYTWTGFYVGAHAGAIFGGDQDFTRGYSGANAAVVQGPGFNAPARSTLSGGSGWLYGGQIGFNYQLSPMFVVGAEADYSGIGMGTQSQSKISTGASFFGNVTERKMDWLATIRGRLGFLLTPQFMVYGTGGFAIAGIKASDSVNYSAGGVTPTGASDTGNKSGWTIGAGAEYLITNNWTVKGEYLYYSLGKSSMFNPGFGPGFPVSYITEFKNKGQLARVGVNYKF